MVTTRTPSGSEGFISSSCVLHALDDVEGVLAVAHHDDAADGVALAVEVGDAAPDLGPEGDLADVAQQHRRPALVGLEHDLSRGRRFPRT